MIVKKTRIRDDASARLDRSPPLHGLTVVATCRVRTWTEPLWGAQRACLQESPMYSWIGQCTIRRHM